MTLNKLLTPAHLLELGTVWGIVWSIFKKEITDWLGATSKRLYARFFSRGFVRNLTQKELDFILKANLAKVHSLLLVLAKEYQPDRITVTRYDKKNGVYLATCLVQVREAEMQSVEEALQGDPVDPAIWNEIVRIHNLPERHHFVPDARLLDIAPMRDALLSSGVRSAYYHSLPTSKGEPWALLAISWHRDHPLPEQDLRMLYYSGLACAAVFSSTEGLNPTTNS